MAEMGTLPHLGVERLHRRYSEAISSSPAFTDVVKTIAGWKSFGWEPIIFGGFIRDIYLRGRHHFPRDVDVVIANRANDELEGPLSECLIRRTSLGGFQIRQGYWNYDVWGLRNTWAFQSHPSTFVRLEDLPKTTFLNIEAVVVTLNSDGEINAIHENGFFQAMRLRTLDLNWEENPNPSLSSIRALSVALKLNFALSRRLALYIRHTLSSQSMTSLIEAQSKHYGTVRLSRERLTVLHRELDDQLSSGARSVQLLSHKRLQLELWPKAGKR